MDYLKVRNLERFQHYKSRRPPWVKLHQCVLEDYEFSFLPDGLKYVALGCILLASRYDNRIPLDPEWIKGELKCRDVPDIKTLLASGFLTLVSPLESTVGQDADKTIASKELAPNASTPLPSRASPPSRETETETETETEERIPRARRAPIPTSDIDAIVSHWNTKELLRGATPETKLMVICRKGVAERLREKPYTVDRLRSAIDRYAYLASQKNNAQPIAQGYGKLTLGEFMTRKGGLYVEECLDPTFMGYGVQEEKKRDWEPGTEEEQVAKIREAEEVVRARGQM